MKQFYSFYSNAKHPTPIKAEKLEAFNSRVKPFNSVTREPKKQKDIAILSPCKQRRALRRQEAHTRLLKSPRV